MKKLIKIFILFLLPFYFQTSLFAEEKSSSSSEQKIEIDLNDPKNIWFTLKEIKKIHKYAVPIDKINLLGVDVADEEKHNKILEKIKKYPDDDLIGVDVVFPDHQEGEGLQKLIDKHKIEHIRNFYYTAPSEWAYFWPKDKSGKNIEKEFRTWRFRNQSIRLYLEIIDRYTSFERDWKYISENSKKGFHDKMEYLYQLYHRWVIVKAMHFAVLKKHVEAFIEETWWKLELWYNLSLDNASKKKTFQSKASLGGEENIPWDTYSGDSILFWSQYLKNSIQTNSREVYLLSNANSNIVPSFQRWAPDSWDLRYDLEEISRNSVNNTSWGIIVSHFFWNDLSWFNDFHSGYEHDIRVDSENFIDCLETEEFPNTFPFYSDVLECANSSVRFVWEDWVVPRNFWYIDTRYEDENKKVFTIGITSTDFIEKNKPYRVTFDIKKIWNDEDVKIELLNELTHYANSINEFPFCNSLKVENRIPEWAACMFKSDSLKVIGEPIEFWKKDEFKRTGLVWLFDNFQTDYFHTTKIREIYYNTWNYIDIGDPDDFSALIFNKLWYPKSELQSGNNFAINYQDSIVLQTFYQPDPELPRYWNWKSAIIMKSFWDKAYSIRWDFWKEYKENWASIWFPTGEETLTRTSEKIQFFETWCIKQNDQEIETIEWLGKCFISQIPELISTIQSKEEWWNWNNTSTWEQWRIPTEDDIVEINGVVTTYDTSISGLVVNSWATLQNHRHWNYTLTINWNTINNWIIKNNHSYSYNLYFYVKSNWNIVNNWIWENGYIHSSWDIKNSWTWNTGYTYLTWTWTRTIIWNKINSWHIRFDENMNILWNPVFEWNIWLNNKKVTLDNWNSITLSGNSSLSSGWNIVWWNLVFFGNISKIRWNITANKFIFNSGSTSYFEDTNLNWNLEIREWAILQNHRHWNYTLTINWNTINDWIIKNNHSYSYNLYFYVKSNWNIVNNWIWENGYIHSSWDIKNSWTWNTGYTYLTWTWTRTIIWNKINSWHIRFDENMNILWNPVFEWNIWLNNKKVTLDNWNSITLSGNSSLSSGWNIVWWNLVFFGNISKIRWNITANKFIFNSGSTSYFEDTNLNWNLEIREWAILQNHRHWNYTLTINWNTINDWIIKNNHSYSYNLYFYVKTTWNIVNNWTWQNSRTYLTWSLVANANSYVIISYRNGNYLEETNTNSSQYDITDKLWETHFMFIKAKIWETWTTNYQYQFVAIKSINILWKQVSFWWHITWDSTNIEETIHKIENTNEEMVVVDTRQNILNNLQTLSWINITTLTESTEDTENTEDTEDGDVSEKHLHRLVLAKKTILFADNEETQNPIIFIPIEQNEEDKEIIFWIPVWTKLSRSQVNISPPKKIENTQTIQNSIQSGAIREVITTKTAINIETDKEITFDKKIDICLPKNDIITTTDKKIYYSTGWINWQEDTNASNLSLQDNKFCFRTNHLTSFALVDVQKLYSPQISITNTWSLETHLSEWQTSSWTFKITHTNTLNNKLLSNKYLNINRRNKYK